MGILSTDVTEEVHTYNYLIEFKIIDSVINNRVFR